MKEIILPLNIDMELWSLEDEFESFQVKNQDQVKLILTDVKDLTQK